jgi:antirestriction protein ArdC
MKVGAIVTCEGRSLSPFNTCLVLNQLPTASMVGGFRQWLDKGRAVKKGEHGLMIWIPTKGKDDKPTAEDIEQETARPNFVMGTVFDISQTEASQNREPIDRQHMDELRQDAADVGSF